MALGVDKFAVIGWLFCSSFEQVLQRCVCLAGIKWKSTVSCLFLDCCLYRLIIDYYEERALEVLPAVLRHAAAAEAADLCHPGGPSLERFYRRAYCRQLGSLAGRLEVRLCCEVSDDAKLLPTSFLEVTFV